MEKNFYTDNFEQLLKENADNFRMYPSKRVWHSIYNDLHPSRRWPSLAIWVLLISSIVYIGLTNKSHIAVSDKNTASSVKYADNIADNTLLTKAIAAQSTIAQPQIVSNAYQNTINNPGDNNSIDNANNNEPVNQPNDKQATLQVKRRSNRVSGNKNYTNIHISATDVSNRVNAGNDIRPAKPAQTIKINNANDQDADNPTINDLVSLAVNNPGNKPETTTETELSIKKTDGQKDNINKKIITANSNTDKEWIEDYAFHNKPFGSKWKANTIYELYFTPSVGYRTLSKSSAFSVAAPSLLAAPAASNSDYKTALSQAAAVNVEIGASLLYGVSKNWRLKAGVQLNYTNYTINAYELKHPTVTTLTLNDINTGLPMLEPRSTTFANPTGVSSKRLNSSTYQVSVPLGADLKLAGKNNLKWYAGATIQPTYIADGNAYLISTDLKNYVEDKSMLRKWNLNAAFETFVSYKTKGGIIVNAGPQFRYQLMSSYSSQYNYNEKLYNVGLKIGIITRF